LNSYSISVFAVGFIERKLIAGRPRKAAAYDETSIMSIRCADVEEIDAS
jgi:hypothetical protein